MFYVTLASLRDAMSGHTGFDLLLGFDLSSDRRELRSRNRQQCSLKSFLSGTLHHVLSADQLSICAQRCLNENVPFLLGFIPYPVLTVVNEVAGMLACCVGCAG